MALVTKDITSYTVRYASFKYSSGVSKVIPSISLFNSGGKVAVLSFVDTYPIPYENSISADNEIKIYFHISHFNEIINILHYDDMVQSLRLEYDSSRGEGSIVRESMAGFLAEVSAVSRIDDREDEVFNKEVSRIDDREVDTSAVSRIDDREDEKPPESAVSRIDDREDDD